MGLCVSRPVVMLSQDSEGCLTQTTYVQPSKAQKQAAKEQRRELIAQYGRQGVREIVPDAYSTELRHGYKFN